MNEEDTNSTESFEDNLEKLRDAALPTPEEDEAMHDACDAALVEPPPPYSPTTSDFFTLASMAMGHAIKAKGGGNVKAWLEAAVGFAKVAGDIIESESWRDSRRGEGVEDSS